MTEAVQPIEKQTQNKSFAKLSVFSLVMITIVSVDSIRNLPATALFGSSLFFFFVLASLFFLLPCALVSAELASGDEEQGGVYAWVKAAFGPQWGFLAVWFQWIENVIWYPALLSFVAGTFGYLIAPSVAQDKYFLISTILISFWGATYINLRGMKTSASFSNFCAISGLLLPMTLIISLGASWLLSGKPLQIDLSAHELLPSFQNSHIWVSLTGIVLSFCGMEIATVHARDAADPQKAFPRALLISAAIIVGSLLFGALAIAIVIPAEEMSLVAGIMQAFHAFFAVYGMEWILPLIALFLVIGVLGSVSNWIIAPTRGLVIAGRDGHMPEKWCVENAQGAPQKLIIFQAFLVTALCSIFLFMPSVNGSYWYLTALAAQLYMLMYMMMFVTGIALRFKAPDRPRLYRIPGGNWGMICVASAGFIGSFVTFCVGFMPPAGIEVGQTVAYISFLLLGLVVMSLPPFILSWRKRREFVDASVTV